MSEDHSNDNRSKLKKKHFSSYEKCCVVDFEQMKLLKNIGSFELRYSLELLENLDLEDLTQEEIDFIIHGIPTQDALGFLNGRISYLF